jgi:proteic killer suppression protein
LPRNKSDFRGRRQREVSELREKRLDFLAAASSLRDLAAIRSNRLEALAGDRKGQHSVRINQQWRICFVWKAADAWDVEIVDYH